MVAEMETNAVHRTNKSNNHFDAIIVGAGISGMYMLYRMRELGRDGQPYF